MSRKFLIVLLLTLFLVSTAQASLTEDLSSAINEVSETVSKLISEEDSSNQDDKSYSSSTEVINTEDFPVNTDVDPEHNEEIWLTVIDDAQNRATVKLWGEVDNFKNYRCYAVVSDEKFYENGDGKAILDPDEAGSNDDYSGDDFNDDLNQEDTVIEVELNSLGEAKLPAPESVSKEVEGSYFDTNLWGNSKLANEGTYLQTQCFKGNTATNMVFTEVGEKAYDTGKDEPEILDDLKHRYYLPDTGKYSLGFVSNGKEEYKNKYTFSNINARSCNIDLNGGLSSPYSGSVVVENKNSYPVKVHANFDVSEGGIGSSTGWIGPDSKKELSFEDPFGIEDFPFSTTKSTEMTATIHPSWEGSGGGECKITCGTIGGTGSTDYPSSCTAEGNKESRKSPADWTKACPSSIDEETIEGKKKCIVNHLGPECAQASDPAAYCQEAMSRLCSYLGLGYDEANVRCITQE